eukprot:CAMPEP_0198719892 /NCGR_PEP_ID=MMETSP1471-20131121/58833_1 /TAXON_ID=41880 /ORGANISM="Pycnococcus provasolii, Strain RCC733" /LENGTH=69 /DNA_ID=CAMNT_0044480681 /DNA_START=192 /DNA_END=398 /DNA_ORIENTATION=+
MPRTPARLSAKKIKHACNARLPLEGIARARHRPFHDVTYSRIHAIRITPSFQVEAGSDGGDPVLEIDHE